MSRLDDPAVMARVHGGLVLAWLALVPVAIYLGWISAVAFVAALSITAMAASHWAAREAATAQRDLKVQLDRIEVAQLEWSARVFAQLALFERLVTYLERNAPTTTGDTE